MSKLRTQNKIYKSGRYTQPSHSHSHSHSHNYYLRNIITLCCIVFSIYVLYKLFKYTYNYIYKSNTDGYTTLTTQGNEDPNTKFTVGFTNINTKNDNENKQNSMKSM